MCSTYMSLDHLRVSETISFTINPAYRSLTLTCLSKGFFLSSHVPRKPATHAFKYTVYAFSERDIVMCSHSVNSWSLKSLSAKGPFSKWTATSIIVNFFVSSSLITISGFSDVEPALQSDRVLFMILLSLSSSDARLTIRRPEKTISSAFLIAEWNVNESVLLIENKSKN